MCDNHFIRTGQGLPSHHEGFTLIELMMIFATIGILATIATPAYQDYIIRAQVTEGLNLTDGAKLAVWDYVSQHGSYPASNPGAGLASATSIGGHYVKRVQLVGGVINVTYGNQANTRIADDVLTLSPTTTAGSINWRCFSTNLEPGYLPSVCR